VKLLKQETAQSLIEFALVAPLFILVLAGIVDYSIYIHQEMELTEAAAAAATYGTIPGKQVPSRWTASIASMQSLALSMAPDVQGATAVASYFYTCTPGGAHVASTSTCTRSNYTTPLMYVTVQTSASVPAALKWVGLASSLSLGATATYRVPWTQ
jgi:Flp pilus assembly protein TadG